MQNPANWSSAVAQQVTDSVNQFVETHTRRCFGEIKTATGERYDWAPAIYLRRMDIVEAPDDPTVPQTVMTIKMGYPHIQQSLLDATSYFWDTWGRVTMYLQNPSEFNVSAVNNDLVWITYQYGYHALGYQEDGVTPIVPDDLIMAALGIAAGFYNWATNNQKDIVAASIGTYRLQFAGSVRGVPDPNGGADPDLPMNREKQHWAILDSYKFKRL